jgi:alternate signal-mediated exported protein
MTAQQITEKGKRTMTTTITTITQRADSRARRRKALIAAVCGGALLLGGSTFALWTESAALSGGSISTGEFGVEMGDETAWDVSPDRTNGKEVDTGYMISSKAVVGHEVEDLSEFGMSPGDKIAIDYPLTVTLYGDNLVAGLTGDFTGFVPQNDKVAPFADVEVYVYDSTDKTTVWKQATGGGLSKPLELGYFASAKIESAGGHAETTGGEEPIRMDGGNTKLVNVLVVVSMDRAVDSEDARSGLIALNNAKFTLTQTRDLGVGDFATPSPAAS